MKSSAVNGGFRAHETALVEEGASVGDGTSVWHHAHVRNGAVVGRDCVLGKNVYVDAGAVVGDRVKVQNNVSVYQGVTLHDDVFVGPSAVFTNDITPRADNADWAVVPTVVRRGASIGANATIVCGVELGERCMVAAGSVVTRSVADHQLVAGNPARPRGWVCDCGRVASRDTERPEALTCDACGRAEEPTGWNIPISRVELGEDEEKLVVEVVRSGRLAQGPMVERLEQEFREWSGCEHVVAVNNGTTALVAALQALGVGPGDEVITSPFSFVATLNAILEAGATAVFADVTEDDFNLDPASIAEHITERTRVLLPVHLYGQAADMPAISALARRHDLAVVEDAAQAHGATVAERRAGSYGIGCFSLYATKNLTSGEGGLVTTNDADVADRLRLLRNQGMRKRYQYEIPGHNYRMTELQAAVAIPQLAKLAERTERRRRNAAALSERLGDVGGLAVPREMPGRRHVWHQYTVRVSGEAALDRDELATRLGAAGIATGIYYPRLMHDYPCYEALAQVRVTPTPRAEACAREALSLPVHPWLTDRELDHIVTTMRELLGA